MLHTHVFILYCSANAMNERNASLFMGTVLYEPKLFGSAIADMDTNETFTWIESMLHICAYINTCILY